MQHCQFVHAPTPAPYAPSPQAAQHAGCEPPAIAKAALSAASPGLPFDRPCTGPGWLAQAKCATDGMDVAMPDPTELLMSYFICTADGAARVVQLSTHVGLWVLLIEEKQDFL